jgi:ATP-dependent Clp protease ATP-binding subunit ClpC
MHHNCVGTEHILLGLMRNSETVAAQVLANLGLTLDAVREEVRNVVAAGPMAQE